MLSWINVLLCGYNDKRFNDKLSGYVSQMYYTHKVDKYKNRHRDR